MANEVLRFGIPKGSLEQQTMELLKKSGWRISVGARSYVPNVDDPSLSFRLLRPQEMPRYIAEGSLDAGITGADWVATWYYGGSELATYTYTTNPTVAGVSIGFLGANEGSVGNFVLATATPEPASIGLFGLGAVGLLLARRKRA